MVHGELEALVQMVGKTRADARRAWNYAKLPLVGLTFGIIVWISLAEMRLLPPSVTHQFEVYFEWESTKGFKTFLLEDPASKNHDSFRDRIWQHLVAIQIEPPLRKHFKKLGWQKINGRVGIQVAQVIPVAIPVALGGDGELIYDPEETSLMHAADNGDTEVVKHLLATGADVNVRDQRGQTALIHACLRGNAGPELIKALLSAAADVNSRTIGGRTPLIVAAGLSGSEIVQELLAAHADPNARDNQGNTALMIASEFGSPRTVQDLLTAGADVNVRNEDGQTALLIAQLKDRTEIVDLLTPVSK